MNTPQEIQRAREALSFIPPDSPETLIRIGIVLKEALGDEAFWIWNEWVQKADPSVLAAAGIIRRPPPPGPQHQKSPPPSR
jgi:hypothetical protein